VCFITDKLFEALINLQKVHYVLPRVKLQANSWLAFVLHSFVLQYHSFKTKVTLIDPQFYSCTLTLDHLLLTRAGNCCASISFLYMSLVLQEINPNAFYVYITIVDHIAYCLFCLIELTGLFNCTLPRIMVIISLLRFSL
jgi:hypothetical protein